MVPSLLGLLGIFSDFSNQTSSSSPQYTCNAVKMSFKKLKDFDSRQLYVSRGSIPSAIVRTACTFLPSQRETLLQIRIPLRTFFFNPVDLLLVSDEDELLTELVNHHRLEYVTTNERN
jgi:hypothetical protein